MGSNWKELTIDELKAPTKSAIAMGPFGSRIKAENFVDTGVPILKGGNLHKAFITEDKLDYLTVSKAEELKTSQAIRRDLVITHRGTIGQVSIIPDNSLHDKYIVSQSQLKVTLNQDLVNPYYVNYFFRSRLGQHRLLANSSQVGVPAIAKASTSVKSILVPCPDLKEQNQIVEVLSSLDNKIELNQQTNQTLEKMAQALFKSWFVDFEPVFDNLLASVDFNLENLETSLPDELKQKAQRRLAALNSLHNAAEIKTSLSALAHELQAQLPTKEATQSAVQAAETPIKANLNGNPKILAQHANTHAHFPNEFEHNEQLGWIPKGWEIKPFKEVIDKYIDNRGKTPPLVSNGIPLIEVKHIPESSNFPSFKSEKQFSLETYNTWFRAHVEERDILISTVGTIGRTAYVKDTKFGIAQNILGLRFGKHVNPEYMFYYIKSHRFQYDMDARLITTVQASIKRKDLDTISILVPDGQIQNRFSEIINSILTQQFSKKLESEQLTKLRDTLLPKLISGELQIPDVTTDEEVVD